MVYTTRNWKSEKEGEKVELKLLKFLEQNDYTSIKEILKNLVYLDIEWKSPGANLNHHLSKLERKGYIHNKEGLIKITHEGLKRCKQLKEEYPETNIPTQAMYIAETSDDSSGRLTSICVSSIDPEISGWEQEAIIQAKAAFEKNTPSIIKKNLKEYDIRITKRCHYEMR